MGNEITSKTFYEAVYTSNYGSEEIDELFKMGNLLFSERDNGVSIKINKQELSRDELKSYIEQITPYMENKGAIIDKFLDLVDLDGHDGKYNMDEMSLFMNTDTNEITTRSMANLLFTDDMKSLKSGKYKSEEETESTGNSNNTEQEEPYSNVSVPLKDLPAGFQIIEDKIYLNDVEIGTVGVEYKDVNHDGYNDYVPVYTLYANPKYIPENCYADENGLIHEFDDKGEDLGILIPQNITSGNYSISDSGDTKKITVAGHEYTIDGNDLKDENGNKVGRVWMMEGNDQPSAIYLYADIDAENTQGIPSDIMAVDRHTDNMVGTSSVFKGKPMQGWDADFFDNVLSDSNKKIKLTKHGESENVEFSNNMANGAYEMTNSQGNVIGYMTVKDGIYSFFVPEDFDPESL